MDGYDLNLSHTEMEALRAYLVTAWHHSPNEKLAKPIAELLDNIEQQTGFRRTRLGEPSVD